MENIKLNITYLNNFIENNEISKLQDKINKANNHINKKTGKGNDFLGWADLPKNIDEELLQDIKTTAKNLIEKSEIIVVIGIGGSYLGAKAIIDALSNPFNSLNPQKGNPYIVYAGNSLSEDYHNDLLKTLDKYDYSVIVISKSGTTTEPAIAFRLIKQHIYKKYGQKEAISRIVAITDKERGALKTIANNDNFKTFIIPDDVGGRYSVLTPVGLIPIACAGFNIDELINGAKKCSLDYSDNADLKSNIIAQYAVIRNLLYNKGKKIEILASFNPKLTFFIEWWKQLYGESEGKENKGIFPAGLIFTTDLHSLGQYMQEGERTIFETIISIRNIKQSIIIPSDTDNIDGLNYLSGKNIDFVNKKAELGTIMAHVEGNVPNIKIELPNLNEYYLGQLIYFFERACALSGYLINVNPFDQPGVEAYKKNMFKLLKE
ncbi:MAG: glucose-6-phosphate isomerase [Bacteroidetes bacterium GWE2_29_8]|nr:MAG: glucose-6-phosphate isomerase [Bacteroidetes bacterium GWE2_29_8]OFY21752.1 MAG: glucose-6-phosphate isomerase [Bacteroidetes bacterium GWF2_29_10]